MKIAIIGAHGTGKTTIAHELFVTLKKLHFSVGIVEEVIRDCPFTINPHVTPEENFKTSYWALLEIQQREMELAEKHDVIICDRSIIDQVVYPMCIMGPQMPDFFLDIFDYWITTCPYDYIFKLPINEDYLRDDSVRDINGKFQRVIDTTMTDFLRDQKILHYPVPISDPMNFIMSNLTEALSSFGE